jgi:prephenate dehydrogenase
MNTNVKEILVIGLGLIGSSIAKVSREKGIKVHGFDINEDSLKHSLENNIIDQSFGSIEEINNNNLSFIYRPHSYCSITRGHQTYN